MRIVEFYNGFPVYIATKEVQKRKHHKKRINKKWKKIYGYHECNTMPHGMILFDEGANTYIMTKKTFNTLRKGIE